MCERLSDQQRSQQLPESCKIHLKILQMSRPTHTKQGIANVKKSVDMS